MSALVVARTTLLRASRRPSTYAIAALAFLPAAVGALAGATGSSALSVGGPVALQLVAPLMVAAMVAGPVGESFENRTVVYWFTRPFPRSMVLLGDALGYAVVAALALVLSGALLAVANALTASADLASLARIPLGMALEGAALVGFAVAVGAMVPRHPVVTTFTALVLTEGVLPRVWDPLAYVSVAYHTGILTGLPFAESGTTGAAALTAPPALASLAVVIAYAVAPLLVAMRVVEERDLT